MSLDDRILAGYTKAAHALQRWTGRTCYWFAQQCAILLGLRLLAGPWIDALPIQGPTWMYVLSGIGFIMQGVDAGRADRAFDADPSVLPAAAKRRSRAHAIFRTAAVVLYALHLAAGLLVGQVYVVSWGTGVLVVSHYYLMAVVPMPPAAQRDRVRGTLIPQGAES